MTSTTSNTRTKTITLCALCVALLSVSALFTVPFGPVPFTLQTLVVFLVALILTPKQAAIATGAYILAGAIGLPVFSSMTGGLGKLLGPTGGFIIAFFVGATLASLVRVALERAHAPRLISDAACVITSLAVSYLLGWLWLMVSMNLDPMAAFLSAIAPFIVIDVCKAVAAVGLAWAVRRGLGMESPARNIG